MRKMRITSGIFEDVKNEMDGSNYVWAKAGNGDMPCPETHTMRFVARNLAVSVSVTH